MNALCLVLACATLVIALPVSASAIENREGIEGHVAAEQDFPYFPHRGNSLDGDVLDPQAFESAEVCRGCHQKIYEEWRSSVMSRAWDDPIYRALLKKTSVGTKGATDNFCSGCHSPVGLLTGKITSDVVREDPKKDTANLPGVDCEACHRLTDISGLTNGAYILDASGGTNIKRGPRKDARSPHHKTAFSALHRQSEMCAVCHNVSHPFNDVPIERTYDEWYESSYRTEGVECQDCHMPDTRGKAALMGPDRKDRATHRFAGANTTLMGYFGATESQHAARQLLRKSATMELVDLPAHTSGGSEISVKVKVSNIGAGHKLPTGFPEGREVWIDFRVSDGSGKEIYRLGSIRDGETEPGTKNFKVHMGDSEGKEVTMEIWRVDRILSDNRILPKGYSTETFDFDIPAGVKGPLTVTATLNYWPFSQAFADALLGPDLIEVQVEEITSAQGTIPVKP